MKETNWQLTLENLRDFVQAGIRLKQKPLIAEVAVNMVSSVSDTERKEAIIATVVNAVYDLAYETGYSNATNFIASGEEE